jgi:hypothetical protein
MRNHLKAVHSQLGALHKRLSQVHKRVSDHHADDGHDELSACHKELSEHHGELSKVYFASCRKLEGMTDSPGDTLPTPDTEAHRGDVSGDSAKAAGSHLQRIHDLLSK